MKPLEQLKVNKDRNTSLFNGINIAIIKDFEHRPIFSLRSNSYDYNHSLVFIHLIPPAPCPWVQQSTLGPPNMTYYHNMVPDIDECQSEPCLNEGTCVDGVNRYICYCQPGFSGNQCEVGTLCESEF